MPQRALDGRDGSLIGRPSLDRSFCVRRNPVRPKRALDPITTFPRVPC